MSNIEKVFMYCGIFLAGMIFGFWGATTILDIIAVKQKTEVVSTIGPEIPKCDKSTWERITDGCE